MSLLFFDRFLLDLGLTPNKKSSEKSGGIELCGTVFVFGLKSFAFLLFWEKNFV